MRTLSLSEARAQLTSVLDQVAAGEQVTITRHGHPVAVVVRPDALRPRRADLAFAMADQIAVELERPRTGALPEPPMSADRSEELAAAVLDDRRAR